MTIEALNRNGITPNPPPRVTSEPRAADVNAEGPRDKTNPDVAKTRRELTPDQQAKVRELQTADRATRAHEQAHMAAGGGLVTHGATYSFRTGPDGKRYAIAGEVGIDMSPEKDPEATIHKMRQVRAAALAPADPSATDRAVAARAQATAAAAQMEIARRSSATSEDATNITSSDDSGEVSDVPDSGPGENMTARRSVDVVA